MPYTQAASQLEVESAKYKSRKSFGRCHYRWLVQRILSGEVAVTGRTTLAVVLALMFQWHAGAAGYFTHYWEAPAIRVKGKRVHLKGSTFPASAINYRLRTQISADGEPYVNLGNPWFRKQDVPAAAVR
jgi:hypothetical protein